MNCATSEPPLEELPPSAKLVHKILEYEGKCTQKELVEETMLAQRTVRYALTRLEEQNLIETHIYFQDARQQLYSLK
ncbi:winged helix-turn-helix domain-containing protein [Halomontanus rarus]|uniref:winged helix-turn-helix domain-containing protein n=1 Tax=Halomontanus rarus TaxID=3034020 RepID=UPI0023E8DF1E|nr:winged helix-turn-helix domain-containing protein [Halovivax sp. TS33]